MKFIAIFIAYLGRIDMIVFAPGVGWFMDSIPLDGLPHCFLRDLLMHDAVSDDWIRPVLYGLLAVSLAQH